MMEHKWRMSAQTPAFSLLSGLSYFLLYAVIFIFTDWSSDQRGWRWTLWLDGQTVREHGLVPDLKSLHNTENLGVAHTHPASGRMGNDEWWWVKWLPANKNMAWLHTNKTELFKKSLGELRQTIKTFCRLNPKVTMARSGIAEAPYQSEKVK